MDDTYLLTYAITWRDQNGPMMRPDGTWSDLGCNNVEAVDEAQARDVFDAFYGFLGYEIISVELYQSSAFAKWVHERTRR